MVGLVFDLFERLGTVGAVLGFLADNHIQLGIRPREGPERGELAWRRPSRAGVTNMLHNPAYAGIYAYGRSTLDPRRRRPEITSARAAVEFVAPAGRTDAQLCVSRLAGSQPGVRRERIPDRAAIERGLPAPEPSDMGRRRDVGLMSSWSLARLPGDVFSARRLRMNTEVVLDGLVLGESPRWHDGRLWVADWAAHELITLDAGGTRQVAWPPGLHPLLYRLAARRAVAARLRRSAAAPRAGRHRGHPCRVGAAGPASVERHRRRQPRQRVRRLHRLRLPRRRVRPGNHRGGHP